VRPGGFLNQSLGVSLGLRRGGSPNKAGSIAKGGTHA